jgi:phosphoglycerol transferase MdoB-like AlkP superfamily enzyme
VLVEVVVEVLVSWFRIISLPTPLPLPLSFESFLPQNVKKSAIPTIKMEMALIVLKIDFMFCPRLYIYKRGQNREIKNKKKLKFKETYLLL